MKRLAWLLWPLLLMVASACSCGPLHRYDLPVKWRPLLVVEEDSSMIAGVLKTRYEVVSVRSVQDFLDRNPDGPSRDSVLAHERIHAVREIALGDSYFTRYANSEDFRWQEESLGWEEQIRVLVQAGWYVDTDWVADVLSGPIYSMPRAMVSHDYAKTWADAQVAADRAAK